MQFSRLSAHMVTAMQVVLFVPSPDHTLRKHPLPAEHQLSNHVPLELLGHRPDTGLCMRAQSSAVLGLAALWLIFHRTFLPMVTRADNAVQSITGLCDVATIACALALGLNRTCQVNVT